MKLPGFISKPGRIIRDLINRHPMVSDVLILSGFMVWALDERRWLRLIGVLLLAIWGVVHSKYVRIWQHLAQFWHLRCDEWRELAEDTAESRDMLAAMLERAQLVVKHLRERLNNS
jgi:hypothetical protein